MCSTCGKRFFAAVSLNKHIRSVHLKKDEEKTKEVVMFNCDHCTVSFPHKFSLGTSIYMDFYSIYKEVHAIYYVSTFRGEGPGPEWA